MMTLSGALIPYGSALPSAISAADGALFYKTDSVGVPQGLYLYGFIADSNPLAIGNQVARGWIQATSPDLFVLKGGDTMLGSLTVPAFLKITQTSSAQRLLIGNQDSGGLNKPSIIQGANGVVLIGTGSTWAGNGGTLLDGLSINPAIASTAGAGGLTWKGGQVWTNGNHGSTSGLDADLLDGSHGAYYRDMSNANAGTLAMLRGGTGVSITPSAGSIFYASTSTTMGALPPGIATYILTSAGTSSAPTWSEPRLVSVGYATTAGTAGSAGTADSADSAGSAGSVPWSGITGIDTARTTTTAGFTTYTRPTAFYDFGQTGVASMTPNNFPAASVSGFDGYSTSDMGTYQVGITVMGVTGGGTRGLQISGDWNFEENIPSGALKYRVNDDTSVTTAWGPFRTIWDQGNLTNLNQLTNGPGFITSSSLTGYVDKTGDTMTGPLTLNGTNSLYLNGITLNGTNGYVEAASIKSVSVNTGSLNIPGPGYLKVGESGVSGRVDLVYGGTSATGYVAFFSPQGGRQGYIGYANAGSISYVAENPTTNHAFSGSITSTGNVTAYSSDGRLKKNVLPIENAVQKVVSLGGYSYDWDMEKCVELGFKPEHEHEHGLIAQDVEKVLPDAVAPAPFNNEYKTVRYDRIVALLTAAIREQQVQIDALVAKVTLLEAK